MPHLEPSADQVALALNTFKKSLDALYWERVKTLTQQWKEGELSPQVDAQFDLQERMTKLACSGRYTSLQARALSAAFQSWHPPTKEEEPNG